MCQSLRIGHRVQRLAASRRAVLAPPAVPARGAGPLRRILLLADAGTTFVAWAAAFTLPDGLPSWGRLWPVLALTATLTVATLTAVASQRLYLARVCNVRAVETGRLARACLLAGLLLWSFRTHVEVSVTVDEVGGGSILVFVSLRISRDAYRAWLAAGRREGRHSRPMVVVGTNDEALGLYYLLQQHPELGFRACGVVGPPFDATPATAHVRWLGDFPDTVAAAKSCGSNGVLVATSALTSIELNRMIRNLHCAGFHVHLSSGLRGIDHRRIRSHPMAHEPLFYLEAAAPASWQRALKRGLDLVGATFALLFALPVLVLLALAIKLRGGPVLARDERVGKGDKPFGLLKLSAELPSAAGLSRVLRATRLDELPQLINVIAGSMSLVGPRPAMSATPGPDEEAVLARHWLRPGITGLGQLEARNNPCLATCQRLDLFYLENWSLTLDVGILLCSVQSVVARVISSAHRWRTDTTTAVIPAAAERATP